MRSGSEAHRQRVWAGTFRPDEKEVVDNAEVGVHEACSPLGASRAEQFEPPPAVKDQ